ncbi:hypothetical protein C6P46_006308 [Rhodotorula mucilaginosa]|uniref:Beige protein homolog 1 n=1 Tax=Rhodotorula mucilaginosa TaxID=5537 RepID=A0A9P6VWD3_RHOMI|nr:hypothetical protein C6P46_006308 [Rhodotorula mucilaginosa]
MLRRFSDAASLLTRQAPPDPTPSPPPSTKVLDVPEGSPALDEALSSDMMAPAKPDFTEQGRTDLRSALRDLQDAPVEDLEGRLGALATVQLVLQEYDSSGMRAAFSADGGYEIVIGALAALGQCTDEGQKDLRFDTATLLFKVLRLVSTGDDQRLAQVSDSLASAFELARLATPDSPAADRLRVIALLVAFATGNFSNGGQQTETLLKRAVEVTVSAPEPLEKLERVLHVVAESDPGSDPTQNQIFAGLPLLIDSMDRLLVAEDDALARLVALVTVLRPDRLADPRDDTSVIELEAAGALDLALHRILPRTGGGDDAPQSLAAEERLLWHEVAVALLDRLGADRRNAYRLFDAMITKDGLDVVAAELVLEGMRAAGDPATVSFDASRGRASCLRLPSVRKPFPPAAHGYTFMAWMSVIEGPTPGSSPLLVFTAADPSLRTYVELSVTPELQLAIKTSLKTPPAVFEGFTFVPGQLYHVAIVHQRPRFSPAAPIQLYINGQDAGSLRINYPAAPPKDWTVEARFGTPSDRIRLVSHPAVVGAAQGPRWHLGPSWLVYGDLSADFVQAAHLLGPRYGGNFQDRLSRFLSTPAAAAADVEADLGQQAAAGIDSTSKSSLSSTLQQRGSLVLPQSRIYFALSAINVLESPPPSRILSPDERVAIEKAVSNGPTIVNTAKSGSVAAIAQSPDSLAVAENAAILRTSGLDEQVWIAGGTTLLLKWIESATTVEQLELAVAIFVEALADSWRLCEEAENTRAYDILAITLRRHGKLITPELHATLLRLAGVDEPDLSVVSSAPAIDNLICDFRLWSASSPAVQRQHIAMVASLVQAEAGAVNVKKLRKCGFFRRLLHAIRSSAFDGEVTEEATDLLLLFLQRSFTVDAVRGIATYLLSTFSLPPSQTDARNSAERILRGIHDLLLDSSQPGPLAKWAKHIHPKWFLAFLRLPSLPSAAGAFAARILVRLLQTQGSAYQARFANSDGGFTVLRDVVAQHWRSEQTLVAFLALLYGYDIDTVSFHVTLESAQLVASPETVSPYAIDIARCILSAVAMCSKAQTLGEESPGAVRENGEAMPVEEPALLLDYLDRVVLEDTDERLIESPVVLRDLYDCLQPLLPAPPVTSLEEISPAAQHLVDEFARIAVRSILARDAPHTPGPMLAQFPSSDACLRPLRAIFDAAAATEQVDGVRFRTLLLERSIEMLARTHVTATTAGRVEAFIDATVGFAFQGWMARPVVLLAFALKLAEQVNDDNALVAQKATVDLLSRLMNSVDRLALLCLKTPNNQAVSAALLLEKFHTTVFAPRTVSDGPFDLLAWRVSKLARGETPVAPACRQLVKLFALEWSAELPPFLQEIEVQGDTTLKSLLVQADDEELKELLKPAIEADSATRAAYAAFSEFEEMTANTAIHRELQRLGKLAASYAKKQESQAGRLEKRLGALQDWTENLLEKDAVRRAHVQQDQAETEASTRQAWARQIREGTEERAPGTSDVRVILDSTEGPRRQRRRVRMEATEPMVAHPDAPDEGISRGKGSTPLEEGILAVDGDSSGAANERTAEPDEADGEDKQRRILHLLEPGDRVLAVYNTSQIQGVETIPTLMLVTEQAVHLVEDYHLRRDGEVVDSWDAPEDERDSHWPDLVEVHERRFLFRNCSLELFFRDGRTFLLSFTEGRNAEALEDFMRRAPAAVASGSLTVQTRSLGDRLAEVITGQKTKLEDMTQAWLRRRVSNFDFPADLMYLNTVAGRTYNDLTSYPVFPWILRDYDSEDIDLNDAATFRDLSKPMGCQDPGREAEFKERYSQLAALDDGSVPFHYGTHYSSAMIATGYLIRLSPFTEAYLDLQGGSFDHADRLFWSVARAWKSASSENRSDVRELTPEFFFLPDFLSNPNKIAFGERQENGETVDNVELPPWAKGNPRLFIEKQREALESEYVSCHLGGWIDLVFGSKQRGQAAVEATNVFHHLSYDGAIDLSTISDADERKAVVSTIHNFGNTPRQLFQKPHPNRQTRLLPKATHRLFAPDLHIEDAASTLVQSVVPAVSDFGQPVDRISAPPSHAAPDRVHVGGFGTLQLPQQARLDVCYADCTGVLRLQERGSGKLIATVEGGHTARISAARFIDPSRLLTASIDGTVGVWKISLSSKAESDNNEFHRVQVMRTGHRAPICSLAVSSAYAVAVSGDEAGRAMLWDTNRYFALRHLDNDEAVSAVAMSDTTGDIATCSGNVLRLWDVNGRPLAVGKTGTATQAISAVAWSLSEVVPLVATGHVGGRISLWRRVADPGTETGWNLELVISLQIEDRLAALSTDSPARPSRNGSPDKSETVSSLTFTSRSLYVGTVSGKVILYNLPPTEAHISDSSPLASACMTCRSKFGLLEGRKRCAGCAGVFCSLCTTRSVEAGGRFCGHCFSRLSPLLVQ